MVRNVMLLKFTDKSPGTRRHGNVHTCLMRAFNTGEFKAMVAKLP